MAIRSGLTLYCYTLPVSTPPVVRAYVAEVDNLSFSTVAPGGFGTLNARIGLKDPTIPQPQLGLFARVALMSRGYGPQANGSVYCQFLGEILDSRLGLDQRGSYITIAAVGAGNWLRDDPAIKTYSSRTPLQIISDQMSLRSVWNPQSADTSACFPDNPGATFSPYYSRSTFEEVIQDVCTLAGDYNWGMWAHASQKDAAGFPLGQLFIHKRDTLTTSYSARVKEGDVYAYEIASNADRAYNHVEIDYSTASGVATSKWSDPRLTGTNNQLQGTAPFRYRSFTRDLTGTATVGATQAASIASTYGAQMCNAPPKETMSLRRVRDAAGNLIPLWAVSADTNITMPELSVRGQQLALAPTAGVNQFYIVRATYSENSGGQDLTLECDNFADRASTSIARLQNRADAVARNANVLQNANTQGQGIPLTVPWSVNDSNTNAGDAVGPTINYPLRLYQPATSHTFSAAATPTHVSSGPFSNDFTISGANAWVVTAGLNVSWVGSATTVGNCIRALFHETGRLHWHCDGCDKLHKGLSIAKHVMVSAPWGNTPGLSGMAIRCPNCQRIVESFNTGLAARDEDVSAPGNHERRAEQARHIRALMTHPLVGLRAHPA